MTREAERQRLAPLQPPLAHALDPVAGVRPAGSAPAGGVRTQHVDAVEPLGRLPDEPVLGQREPVPLGQRVVNTSCANARMPRPYRDTGWIGGHGGAVRREAGARARRGQPALDRMGDRRAARLGGAQLAFTYQGERIEKSVRDLAATVNTKLVTPLRRSLGRRPQPGLLRRRPRRFGGGLDVLVHSVAFAAARALEGRFVDTLRDRFWMAVDMSAYSLVALRKAEPSR